MITKISDKVWKHTGSDMSNMYFLDVGKKIVIDAGNRSDRQEVSQFLGKVVDFADVEIVIFTHLHYDHIGNFDLFPNAEFYASEEEIKAFEKSAYDTVLSEEIVEKFKIKLKPLPSKLEGLEIIKTPGHTSGSVCIWYPAERILFTGDTLFRKKATGRTDLPTSVPKKLNESILKLVEYNARVLAPGHDY